MYCAEPVYLIIFHYWAGPVPYLELFWVKPVRKKHPVFPKIKAEISPSYYESDFLFCVLPIIPDLIIRGLSGQVTLFCIPVISQWREHFSGPSRDWIIANRMLWCWCWSSSRTPSTMWSVHLKPNSAGNICTNQPSTLFTTYLIDPLK